MTDESQPCVTNAVRKQSVPSIPHVGAPSVGGPVAPLARSEHMQLSGNGPEGRMAGNRGLEIEQIAQIRGVVNQRTRHEICKNPHPMHLEYPHSGRLEQTAHARLVEPSRQRVADPPPASGILQCVSCVGKMTCDRSRKDGGDALCDQRAGEPVGAKDSHDTAQRLARIVDDLEDAVAEHHVGGIGSEQLHQVRCVALNGIDPTTQTSLGGSPLQRCERVGTGIDHSHPVSLRGEGYGEPASAPARVDDVDVIPPCLGRSFDQSIGQHVPDDSGPHVPT